MPGPTETYVQVAPDSSGKKIRNLQVQLQQTDGTFATVLMQVVSIADENGNPMVVGDTLDWQMQLLDEMRAIRIGVQEILDAGAVTMPGQKSDDDLLERAQAVRDVVQET
jgi:hypothetical protein